MFKPRVFKNGLTEYILKESPDLDHVIFHKDLSITLRNEPKALIDFLFSPENYEKLIDYALFDKEAELEEYKKLRINQINKNAANILSNSGAKVRKKLSEIMDGDKPLLLQKLEDFLKNDQLSKNQLYAGHFSKIYENTLRLDSSFQKFFTDDFVQKLLPFLAENILIIPYKELIEILLEDLTDKIGEDYTNRILKTILQHASFFSYVTFSQQFNSQPPNNLIIQKYKEAKNYYQTKQTLNKGQTPIPSAPLRTDIKYELNEKKIKIAKKKGNSFFPKKYKLRNPGDFDFKEAKSRSFLCLLNIYQSIINNEKNELLHDIELIEMLLYCGVFCHPDSLSSMEAFKILVIIRYGIYDAEPYEDSDFLKLIDEYAEYITFSSDFLTNQTVGAFPLLWNHVYNDKTDNQQLYANIDPVLNMDSYHEFPKGLTPFLLLRPLLFSDPPINDNLNNSYLYIFDQLIKKFKKLTNDNDKDMNSYEPEIQEQIRDIHFIVYEFLLRPFSYNNQNLSFYNALYQIIPYFPESKSEAENGPKQHRALLNGHPIEICLKILKSNLFVINSKASILLQDIESSIDFNSVIYTLDYENRKFHQ